ncbi:MAG: multicopper oxidase domain-containing protein [Alkalibacterium sp.]|nr:multicopper oxidase domain-containing protein [Alkalibacterium sp.]
MRKLFFLLSTLILLVLIAVFLFNRGPLSLFHQTDREQRNQSESIGDSQREEESDTSLPIPPLLDGIEDASGSVIVDLAVQNGTKEFFPGIESETMGYKGAYLGPTIRVRDGQEVSMNVENRLEDERTTVHWHGLKVDAEQDGGPHSSISPGETWTPEFTVDQSAATLWYHPHLEETTGRQVYKGLAGLLIVDDDISDELSLPAQYGVNDIPLIIQDKRFDEEGQLDYSLDMQEIMDGLHGDRILVNGMIDPVLVVEAGVMRFRLLNGANARLFNFRFDDGQSFYQIASDGGLLQEPVESTELILGPSERAEILIDFSEYEPGDKVMLSDQDRGVLEFIVGETENDYSVPETLVEIEAIDPETADRTRTFVLSGIGMNVNINGKQFDPERIDEVVNYGDTEIWEVSNESGMGMGMGAMMGSSPHPFHVHGVQFQILDRNGQSPEQNERGWKDSFMVYPDETVRVITTFSKRGVFMYHCHILEHEDAGMMGQFEVR